MDKQSILDAVSQALDAMGMSSGEPDGDEYDEMGTMSKGELPVWNRLNVTVPSSSRGPIANKGAVFSDTGGNGFKTPKYIGNDPYRGKTDAYGMPMAGDDEMMMASTGMV